MCGYVQNLLSGGDDGVAIRGRSYGAAGGNQDEVCAIAGLNKIKDRLR